MDNIVESTSGLVQNVLHSVKDKLLEISSNSILSKEFEGFINEAFASSKDPVEGLGTEHLQKAYIKKNLNYVDYKEVTLGSIIVRRKKQGNMTLLEKEENFIYVPFLESLQQLLSNQRIANFICRKPNFAEDGVLYDICDGSLFKNDSFFTAHPDALQIIIYHDGVEVCNPLSSHAGKHKLDMFYYSIGNLSPKLRSKRCAIRLLGIVNAKLVKKYGYDPIVKPVIDDIKKLERGWKFVVNGKEREIYGKVVSCTGDTEGQHEWAGLKVGVGFSFQKCRHCYCTFEPMQEKFLEDDFLMRSKESHKRNCQEIEHAPTEAMKNDLKVAYGIKNMSILCDLHKFDVITQLPQDIMHTLLEGVVQYETRFMLQSHIQNGDFTLQQLNAAISNHSYGYGEVADKPGPIAETVFQGDEKYKLKYNAAQARLFLRLLPFFLSGLISEDSLYIEFLASLIRIVQVIFSPVVKIETMNILKDMIADHLRDFKRFFPTVNITPKQHYLIHIPEMTKRLGPMVRHSCFGFESVHNYFKRTAQKQNFKNITKSLAERCQMMECCNYGDEKETASSHPLFSTDRKYGVLKKATCVIKQLLRSKLDVHGFLPGIELSVVYKASWVMFHGTKFQKTGIIAVEVDQRSSLPLFGIIENIWVICDFVYLEYLSLQTVCFAERFQAYQVEETHDAQSLGLCPYERLVDFNVFHLKKNCAGDTFVPVKYDIVDLVQQHLMDKNPLKY